MNKSTISDSIVNLSSLEFSVQEVAKRSIININSSEDLQVLFNHLYHKKKYDLSNLYFKLLNTIILKNNKILLEEIFSQIFKLITVKNLNISMQTEDFINNAFEHRIIESRQLLLIFESLWPKLSQTQKLFPTRFIGQYKINRAFHLIVENLYSGDEKLLLITFLSLQKLKDPRTATAIHRYIKKNKLKKINPTSQSKIIIEFIKTIAITQKKYLYKYLIPFYIHEDIKIRVVTYRAAFNVFPKYFLKHLLSNYLNEQEDIVLQEMILLVAQDNSPRSTSILLQLLEKEQRPNLILRIQWAIQNIDFKNKIKPLKKFYRKCSNNTKRQIVNLIGLSQHPESYEILLKIVEQGNLYSEGNNEGNSEKYNEENNEEILLEAIKAISRFNNSRSIKPLSKLIKLESNQISNISLISLLEHSKFDSIICLEEILTDPLLKEKFKQSILLSLSKNKNSSYNKIINKFIMENLEVNDERLNTYAIKASIHHFSKDIYNQLINNISNMSKYNFLEIIRIINYSIPLDPSLICLDENLFIDKSIYSELESDVINKQTFECLIKNIDHDEFVLYKNFFNHFIFSFLEEIFFKLELIVRNEDAFVLKGTVEILSLLKFKLNDRQIQILKKVLLQTNDNQIKNKIFKIIKKCGTLDCIDLLLPFAFGQQNQTAINAIKNLLAL